ncbi:MAG: hypothetical protein WAV31_02470 [Candidatus Moraniibacteriota bacterium]
MDQNIVNYLEQNKNSYPKEVLIEELKKAAHPEGSILEAIDYVYSSTGELQKQASGMIDFWDFKAKITYHKSSEKWKDFLFGLFVPSFIEALTLELGFVFMIIFIVEIFIAGYLFNRRRFIFYGFISRFLLVPFLIISFWFMWGTGSLIF